MLLASLTAANIKILRLYDVHVRQSNPTVYNSRRYNVQARQSVVWTRRSGHCKVGSLAALALTAPMHTIPYCGAPLPMIPFLSFCHSFASSWYSTHFGLSLIPDLNRQFCLYYA